MLLAALFPTLLAFSSAILAVNRFEIATNEDAVSGGIATIKNISTGLLISVQGTVMRDIEKLVAYGRFNVPENSYDHKYRKELLRTVVDVEKILKGVTTNFLSKSVMEVLKSSLDFQFNFPIKKGFIKFTNITVTDKYYPPIFTKGLFHLRFVGRMTGSKKIMTFISEYKTYIEIV